MEETIAMLQAQIQELQKECQELRNQLALNKQEKQDSPHTPFQIKEKNNNNDSKIGSAEETKKGRKKVFIPPTIQDVQTYMDQIGETRFTAEKFWNYYEARGWTLGKSKMRYWKVVLDNWGRGNKAKCKEERPEQNIVTFKAYKPVDNTGAVSYEEYLKLKEKGEKLIHNSKFKIQNYANL